MNNNFVFFWGGPFSQWYPSEFTIGGTTYNCAEQYMMAQKALLFGDEEAYKKIMNSRNPSEQKATGRLVKGFDVDKWNLVCKKVVYDANLAKFSSDPELKAYMMYSGDKEIVEASPYDTIWGIGMGEGDPNRFDRSKWRGTNWLGEVLMQIRDTLKNS